jgi:hypothetical protein
MPEENNIVLRVGYSINIRKTEFNTLNTGTASFLDNVIEYSFILNSTAVVRYRQYEFSAKMFFALFLHHLIERQLLITKKQLFSLS